MKLMNKFFLNFSYFFLMELAIKNTLDCNNDYEKKKVFFI